MKIGGFFEAKNRVPEINADWHLKLVFKIAKFSDESVIILCPQACF
jgi:hypothetical protein